MPHSGHLTFRAVFDVLPAPFDVLLKILFGLALYLMYKFLTAVDAS